MRQRENATNKSRGKETAIVWDLISLYLKADIFSELLWSVCVAGFCHVVLWVSELSTAAWESSAENPEEVDTLWSERENHLTS